MPAFVIFYLNKSYNCLFCCLFVHRFLGGYLFFFFYWYRIYNCLFFFWNINNSCFTGCHFSFFQIHRCQCVCLSLYWNKNSAAVYLCFCWNKITCCLLPLTQNVATAVCLCFCWHKNTATVYLSVCWNKNNCPIKTKPTTVHFVVCLCFC